MAKPLNYKKNIAGRVSRNEALWKEMDDSSIATGIASRFHAERFARLLSECLGDEYYEEPGPKWLKEAQDELLAGRCSTLTRLRIVGLRYALDCKRTGKPSREWKPRRPSVATLKWRANAKAFEEMTQKRPMLPPHRRNK